MSLPNGIRYLRRRYSQPQMEMTYYLLDETTGEEFTVSISDQAMLAEGDRIGAILDLKVRERLAKEEIDGSL